MPSSRPARSRRLTVALVVVTLALVVQVIPYGHQLTNPPVGREPSWDSPATRELAKRACFDCHSNETTWPTYARVAPVSWLIQHDVDEGRSKLNFSEWDRLQRDATDTAKEVMEKDMPPSTYLLMHPLARLTDAEREQLVRGLQITLGDAHDRRVNK